MFVDNMTTIDIIVSLLDKALTPRKYSGSQSDLGSHGSLTLHLSSAGLNGLNQ